MTLLGSRPRFSRWSGGSVGGQGGLGLSKLITFPDVLALDLKAFTVG